MTAASIVLLAQAAPPASALASAGSRSLESGRVAEAEAAFQQSLRMNPAGFEALSGLGFIRYSRRQFAEARVLLEKAVAARPVSFQANFLLGATLVELRDSLAAIRALGQAVKLNPSHIDARKLLAAEHLGAQQFTGAIHALSSVAAAQCDEECSLLLIEAKQGAGDTAGAFALARQSAKRFPGSAQIAAWLGFQLQFAGRYDEAAKALTEAMRLDPNFAMPIQLLGEVHLRRENFNEAKAWLERAAEKMPGDVEVLLSFSRAVAGTGDLAGAVEILRRAAPGDARVHLQLSRLYYRLGDVARAETEAERVKSAEAPAAARVWWRRR